MSTNLSKLNDFVAGHIRIAAGKPAAQAERHLTQWADWLNGQMSKLGCDSTPDHLKGLTAFDLANARDDLMAATVARAA